MEADLFPIIRDLLQETAVALGAPPDPGLDEDPQIEMDEARGDAPDLAKPGKKLLAVRRRVDKLRDQLKELDQELQEFRASNPFEQAFSRRWAGLSLDLEKASSEDRQLSRDILSAMTTLRVARVNLGRLDIVIEEIPDELSDRPSYKGLSDWLADRLSALESGFQTIYEKARLAFTNVQHGQQKLQIVKKGEDPEPHLARRPVPSEIQKLKRQFKVESISDWIRSARRVIRDLRDGARKFNADVIEFRDALNRELRKFPEI